MNWGLGSPEVCSVCPVRMLMARRRGRQEVGSDVAGVRVGVRGSERRETASDWGAGGWRKALWMKWSVSLTLKGR